MYSLKYFLSLKNKDRTAPLIKTIYLIAHKILFFNNVACIFTDVGPIHYCILPKNRSYDRTIKQFLAETRFHGQNG
jgi:hypothetical protein